MEMTMAMLVLIGILVSIVSFVKDVAIVKDLLGDVSVFKEYLGRVFTIVIGIEFLEMLCRPSLNNVMQVLIFLVARHMIVGNNTPYEDFVSVVSVALLFILYKFVHTDEKKNAGKNPPDEKKADTEDLQEGK